MQGFKILPVVLVAYCACLIVLGPPAIAEENGFDRAWSYLTLYDDGENVAIQKVALVGRAQVDSFWVNPEEGEKVNDTLWRRFRFGFKSHMFADGVAHLKAYFNINEPIYEWYLQLTNE